VFVVRVIHSGHIAEFFNVKADGTYNNHHSQNSFDELLPPSSKFVWSKNSSHLAKWVCFYITRCNCSSGGSLHWVGTMVEETGVMWQVWKGCDEFLRCNG